MREEEESNKYGNILEHPVGRVECSENKISVATHKLTSCLHICRQHVSLCVLMQCFVLWSGFCSQILDSYSLIHFHSSPGNRSRSSSSCPLSTRCSHYFSFLLLPQHRHGAHSSDGTIPDTRTDYLFYNFNSRGVNSSQNKYIKSNWKW